MSDFDMIGLTGVLCVLTWGLISLCEGLQGGER